MKTRSILLSLLLLAPLGYLAIPKAASRPSPSAPWTVAERSQRLESLREALGREIDRQARRPRSQGNSVPLLAGTGSRPDPDVDLGGGIFGFYERPQPALESTQRRGRAFYHPLNGLLFVYDVGLPLVEVGASPAHVQLVRKPKGARYSMDETRIDTVIDAILATLVAEAPHLEGFGPNESVLVACEFQPSVDENDLEHYRVARSYMEARQEGGQPLLRRQFTLRIELRRLLKARERRSPIGLLRSWAQIRRT